MKGKTSAVLVLVSVLALGTAGYFTGVVEFNLPDNSDDSTTEYLTIYINSYNFTQILQQDYTINYTVEGFGTFDLYQNESLIGAAAQGVEGLKIYAWCSLNFTPEVELKDKIGVNTPRASQTEDEEEEEEPIQARPRPYCWEYSFYDVVTEVNIITTVIISFGDMEAVGYFDDLPPGDPVYRNSADTTLQIQLSKGDAMVPIGELSAEDLTGITSGLFDFTPDDEWGYSAAITQSSTAICMITNAEGQVEKLLPVP